MARARKTANLDSEIAKLAAEFAENIRRLVVEEIAAKVGEVDERLARVQAALNVAPSRKRRITGKKSRKAAAKGTRRKRADVEEVKRAALGALKAAGSPVKMGELVEETPFSAAQLRRALAELNNESVVVKVGEKRATTYSLAGGAVKSGKKRTPRKTGGKTGTAKKKSAARKRAPRKPKASRKRKAKS